MGEASRHPQPAAGLALQPREVRRWLAGGAGLRRDLEPLAPPWDPRHDQVGAARYDVRAPGPGEAFTLVEDVERHVRAYLDAADHLNGTQHPVADRLLAELHERGLALREGEPLATREEHSTLRKLRPFSAVRYYAADQAGRLTPTGERPVALRVCHGAGCGRVFRPPPAGTSAHCPRCRRSPAPEVKFNVAHGPARWVVGRDEHRRVTYEGRCVECEHGFTATDPRQGCCRACGDSAGRVRRSRGGGQAVRVWRWRHAEGHTLFTVNVCRGMGDSQLLVGADGVLATNDAELARLLDTLPALLRA